MLPLIFTLFSKYKIKVTNRVKGEIIKQIIVGTIKEDSATVKVEIIKQKLHKI